jgi:hypothetical protein
MIKLLNTGKVKGRKKKLFVDLFGGGDEQKNALTLNFSDRCEQF